MPAIKRILILYADAGFGHRSAAFAVKKALEEIYGSTIHIDIVNPLQDERTPFYLRDSQEDYDTIIRSVPELYRMGYEASDASVPTLFVESALILMLYDVLKDLVQKLNPDVIVTTYPIYQAPLDAIFTLEKINAPIAAVVTDLVDVHRIWFNVGVERLFVPTPAVQQQALHYGLPEEKVVVTGIPVSTTISNEHRSKAEIRESLSLDKEIFTLLVAGSKRVEGLPKILEGLNHSGHPILLVMVAGGDDDLYQQFRGVDWHVPVRIYNYVDFIPSLLRASDAIICKAGGLIVSEAMSAGLPLILINVLPGQESGNADYVVSNGAGELAENSQQLLEIVSHWLQNDRQIHSLRKTCSVNNGKPEASFQIAREIYNLSENKVTPRTVTHLFERSHLVSLLRKYRQKLQERIEQLD